MSRRPPRLAPTPSVCKFRPRVAAVPAAGKSQAGPLGTAAFRHTCWCLYGCDRKRCPGHDFGPGLRTVYLHGQEPVEYLRALAPLAIIKALAVRDESIYDQISEWTAAGAAAILLDKPRTADKSDPAPMPGNLRRRRRSPGTADGPPR